jgi:hypothetical protein
MKKFGEMTAITLLAFLVFILHLSAFVARSEKLASSDGIGQPARPVEPQSEQMKFSGRVKSVDLTAKTFVAKPRSGGTGEMSFDLTFARFLRGYKMEQMKVGDSVAFKYVVNDGKSYVTFIVAVPLKPSRVKTYDEAKPAERPSLGPDRM